MLTMVDGPPANLPAGAAAYAGYVNPSGIGVTYPTIVAEHPDALHLSITTAIGYVADCGDVESGALSTWIGYRTGYCSVANVNTLVLRDGRPAKLWTAHFDPAIGAHICGPDTCNYIDARGRRLVTSADATQWTDHPELMPNNYDESVCLESFFSSPIPLPEVHEMSLTSQPCKFEDGSDGVLVYGVGAGNRQGQLLEFRRKVEDSNFNSVIDITDQIGTPDPYTVQP